MERRILLTSYLVKGKNIYIFCGVGKFETEKLMILIFRTDVWTSAAISSFGEEDCAVQEHVDEDDNKDILVHVDVIVCFENSKPDSGFVRKYFASLGCSIFLA